MHCNGLKVLAHCVLAAVLLALLVSCDDDAPSNEPYRMVSPSAGGAPHPAVLLVPGCSGFAAVNGINPYDERAADLQAAGYFVVFVDYLGRRKQSNCGHVSKDEVGNDILDAATWTRGQPGVDPARISVIGWSYGGGGVLAALRSMPPGLPTLTKAVVYYPDCRGATPWSAAGISVLMLLAANDDVARPVLCDPVAKGAPAGSLRVIVYPDAYHGFDERSLPARAQYPFGTLGYNAEAAKASWEAARDFIK